ncbi:glycine betaine ABC transporter substrate-binding protein [Paenibacillus pinihumi]|uniref:glycine betaine ABC transporter substrate-binding protein n=1 Tax=Paenibacillus pinihumi TaxID=669462 RepID=UPI00040FF6BB|nr:glycine betaine ABC transporter substrate-binding protein [Paenibacillus pinihumi]
MSALEAHPELEKVLGQLAGKITDAAMQNLNGEVELKQRPPLEVAKQWLTENGLLTK